MYIYIYMYIAIYTILQLNLMYFFTIRDVVLNYAVTLSVGLAYCGDGRAETWRSLVIIVTINIIIIITIIITVALYLYHYYYYLSFIIYYLIVISCYL